MSTNDRMAFVAFGAITFAALMIAWRSYTQASDGELIEAILKANEQVVKEQVALAVNHAGDRVEDAERAA